MPSVTLQNYETTPLATINALLQLIYKSTKDAVTEYQRTGYGIPSLSSDVPHPADGSIPSVSLRKSIRTLEAATFQLCATLNHPDFVLVNVRGLFLHANFILLNLMYSLPW